MLAHPLEWLSARARHALELAGEQSSRFGHVQVEPENLLFGLVAEGEGLAARALSNLGLSPERVQDDLEMIDRREHGPPGSRLEMSTATSRALELAAVEAVDRGHVYIGTEDLLLGLAREPGDRLTQIIEGHGLGWERVRAEVRRLEPGRTLWDRLRLFPSRRRRARRRRSMP